jgi:hypothetical protein
VLSSPFSPVPFSEELSRNTGMFRAFWSKEWRTFSAVQTSLSKICPLCHKRFPRESAVKFADYRFVVFMVEQEFLEQECPLNPKSPTKKHTEAEVVERKLPD